VLITRLLDIEFRIWVVPIARLLGLEPRFWVVPIAKLFGLEPRLYFGAQLRNTFDEMSCHL